MIKNIMLICFGVFIIYSFIVELIDYNSYKRPIPEKVKDIYDENTYINWKKYKKSKSKFSLIFNLIEILIIFVLLIFNVHSKIANLIEENVYTQSLIVMGLYISIDFILSVIRNYIDTMIIEEKYGFNKTKLKTFIIDQIRSLIISSCLMIGLMMLFIWLYNLLGFYIVFVFVGLLVLLLLLFMMLYPYFAKMSNKYEELEDGELKTKLTNLLNKYGFSVRKIEVMKASERTTKSNASFSGAGKTKTIVLYDNLINNMTPDEICAVFAHELGHGLHKDGFKNNITTFFLVMLIVGSLFGLISYFNIYKDFGFNNINYGFAFVLLTYIILPYASTLIGLISNAVSRRAEYRADEQAVIEGYGKDLITGLKKLAKSNYVELNPSKLIVLLSYSHPPMVERITNIEKNMEKYNK